jgi:fatty-acyl-CoA synthase
MHYEDLLIEQSEDFEWPTLNENDACGMCYTNGTGFAKGVYILIDLPIYMLRTLYHQMREITIMDTILLVVPQFHVMAGFRIYVCCLDQTWCYPLFKLTARSSY